jgi:hypothetical protein
LAILAIVGPAAASAKPGYKAPNKLTINTTQNPIPTGDAVTLYGQLQNVSDVSDRTVTLYHRLPNQRHFTRVQTVKTNAAGFWQIDRAEGVVRTNRAWFVTVNHLRSRTIVERVHATVTLNGPSAALTNERVVFAGHVSPAKHRGDRVVLQRQVGDDGDDYATIKSVRIGSGSNYTIPVRFKTPGTRTLRVVFKGDRFNIRGESNPVSIDVSQRQNENETLSASKDPITFGESVTLSGVVKGAAAGTQVVLRGHTYKQAYSQLAATTTDAGGAYSFTVSPTHNTVYQTKSEGRTSAQVFEGVRDAVTITASSTTSKVGESVTFIGFVAPDKAGHVVYLQKKGDDGDFHTVNVSRVKTGSSYSLTHRFGSPGTKVFRVLVPGGPYNHRGISPTATVTVDPRTQP